MTPRRVVVTVAVCMVVGAAIGWASAARAERPVKTLTTSRVVVELPRCCP